MDKLVSVLLVMTIFSSCQTQSQTDQVMNQSDTVNKLDTINKTASISNTEIDSTSKANKFSENKDQSSKVSTGDLEIVNSNITYNNNFEPILNIAVKNNLAKTVIAFEIEINPSECDIQTIRKKINLSPGKTLSFHQRIQSGNNCSLGNPKIYIGDYVLSDGTKRDPGDLYLIRRENWKK